MRFIGVCFLSVVTFAVAAPLNPGSVASLPSSLKIIDDRVQKTNSNDASTLVQRQPPLGESIGNAPGGVPETREPISTDALLSLLGGGIVVRTEAGGEAIDAREPISTNAIISLAGGRIAMRDEGIDAREPISSNAIISLAGGGIAGRDEDVNAREPISTKAIIS